MDNIEQYENETNREIVRAFIDALFTEGDSDGRVGAHFDGLSGAHLLDGFNGAHPFADGCGSPERSGPARLP